MRIHLVCALCGCLVACVEDRRRDVSDTVSDSVVTDTAAPDIGGDAADGCDPARCPPTGNACQENVCNASGGCSVRALPATTGCDDDDACTRDDRCGSGAEAGQCVGRDPVVCVAAGDCGAIGTCNPLSGVCDAPVLDDGTRCGDAADLEGAGHAPGVCSAGECHRLPFLAVGPSHACAVLWNGGLRCWGHNDSGQLGLGHARDVGDGMGLTVGGVAAVQLPHITWVGLGIGRTCVVSDGSIRCWGSNSNGSLGYGDTTTRGADADTTPDKIPPLDLGAGFVPVAVVVSLFSSCALSSDGGVKCWGVSAVGYPGVPAVGTPDAPAIADMGLVSLASDSAPFVVEALVRSTWHTCALAAGKIRCWGATAQLGNGATEVIGDNEAPSAAPIVNESWVATSLATMDEHTCAVSPLGQVYCWGNNLSGQIGTGTMGNNVPTPYGPITFGEGLITAKVAVGRRHTCALFTSGDVRCWGINVSGQLGRGNTDPELVPSEASVVDLGGDVYDVAAGWEYTCAVMRDGAVRCWGLGENGRLGDDATEDVGDEAGEMPPAAIAF